MNRRGWKWGAVVGVLGLVLWFALLSAPEATSPEGQGSFRDSRVGTGLHLPALSQSAPTASGDMSLSIRGRVTGARGPVAGARVLASAVVAGESLSELPCGQDVEESVLECSRAGRLAGFVTRREGEAPVLARVTSEADGSFSLEGLKAGRYALWAESPEGTGMLHDVSAGSEGVELVLGEGVRVSGLVHDEDRAPVAGALITAVFITHSRYFETVTDVTGRFHLGPLPRGEYVLLASKEGLLSAHLRFTGYAREVERKFLLYRPRRVSGQVMLEGAPVAGASVKTWSHEEGSELEVLTDAAGRFSFEGLSPFESYELIATRDGLWANTRVDFETQGGPPRFLADRTELILELLPMVEVTGVVRDEAGRPIERAVVDLRVKEGEDFLSVSGGWTDAEGRYLLGPVRPGTLRLDVSLGGLGSSKSHEAVFPAGTSTVDFVLQLEDSEIEEEAEPEDTGGPLPTVVGEVVDELGVPVPGATVLLGREDSKWWGDPFDAVLTDTSGHFSLEAPTEGRYRVMAALIQDDVSHTVSRVVELGSEGARVQLRFEQGQVLSGVVVDTRGKPLEGAWVEVHSVLGGEPSRRPAGVQTGLDGRFTFQSVSGGQLELGVTRPGYGPSCAEREDGRSTLLVKPGDRELRAVLVRKAFVRGRLVQKDGSPITAFVLSGAGRHDEEGRFSMPIRCSGTLELEWRLPKDVKVPGSRRMQRSVAVQEEVDVDLGALVFDAE
ncbi:carboxypeptidase regulatory-like domain-containing protein [Archangium lansingense]|uniref:carboxypeptidase regulatory-like domain-containing protein n=1 Tax=Archangium lansingense TaxID=2995310 RepID=UPI003B7A0771